MQIHSSAYLGVETLVRLAAYDTDKPCTTRGLAQWINRSVAYTEGLMARLCAAGLAVAWTGPGGGYTLARPAERITVADVFEAVDEPSGLSAPPLNATTLQAEDIRALGGTDLLWEMLRGYVLRFLDGVSLADLVPQTAILVDDDGTGHAAIHRPSMRSTARH